MNTNGHRGRNTSGKRRSFGWVVDVTVPFFLSFLSFLANISFWSFWLAISEPGLVSRKKKCHLRCCLNERVGATHGGDPARPTTAPNCKQAPMQAHPPEQRKNPGPAVEEPRSGGRHNAHFLQVRGRGHNGWLLDQASAAEIGSTRGQTKQPASRSPAVRRCPRCRPDAPRARPQRAGHWGASPGLNPDKIPLGTARVPRTPPNRTRIYAIIIRTYEHT